MPYKNSEQKAEALRRWRKRHEVPKSLGEVPECKVANDEIPDLEVPGFDGKMKIYDPETDGVNGWRETDKGMKYILQDTGMGGMVRHYGPGARMFSYRRGG